VVTNAGGRAFEAIRSLSVLQHLANVQTIIVMHHTDCGTTHIHDEELRKDALEESPEQKALIDGFRFGEILTP
jgi:carbonic anhydrase